jgi:hypothetical protein
MCRQVIRGNAPTPMLGFGFGPVRDFFAGAVAFASLPREGKGRGSQRGAHSADRGKRQQAEPQRCGCARATTPQAFRPRPRSKGGSTTNGNAAVPVPVSQIKEDCVLLVHLFGLVCEVHSHPHKRLGGPLHPCAGRHTWHWHGTPPLPSENDPSTMRCVSCTISHAIPSFVRLRCSLLKHWLIGKGAAWWGRQRRLHVVY